MSRILVVQFTASWDQSQDQKQQSASERTARSEHQKGFVAVGNPE
ncbi:MAG: hypothetical protein ACREXY_04510 [Gammaproteobacteria bacterium]